MRASSAVIPDEMTIATMAAGKRRLAALVLLFWRVKAAASFAPWAAGRTIVLSRSLPTSAHVILRELSDEDIATLRREYDGWISRDPKVREPQFWALVKRAKERRDRLEMRKRALAEQLTPLRDVLTVWQALTGLPLLDSENQITPAGWTLTVLAAAAPIAALELLGLTGRVWITQVAGVQSTAVSSFPAD